MKKLSIFFVIFVIICEFSFTQNDSINSISKCDTIDFEYIYKSIEELNRNYNNYYENSDLQNKKIENSIKDLKIQISSLSSEIANINTKLALNNRSILENYIGKLQTIEELSDLYKDISENLLYEINSDSRLAFIADINNPGSDELGFKFTDIIQNAALSTIDEISLNSGQKEKFESKLKNVISGVYTFTSHDFARQIASLNPAANATITVFNFLANYYTADYSTTGLFSKNIEVNEKALFSEKQLTDYLSSIEEFIIYYDELSVINQDFKLKLNQLEQDFNSINQNINDLDSIIRINNKIIIDLDGINVTNNDIFEISSIYSKTLENVKSINDLLTTSYQDYIFIREDFYTNYIEHIKKSEELLKNKLVKNANKTLATKNRENLIEMCNDGMKGLDRYNADLDEIKSIFNEIW